MLVTIKINYPTVDDIDGDIASEIIDALTADTVTMTNFWKAHGVTCCSFAPFCFICIPRLTPKT